MPFNPLPKDPEPTRLDEDLEGLGNQEDVPFTAEQIQKEAAFVQTEQHPTEKP